MRVRAYAKLNLSLRIGSLREDGLHSLDGLFTSISWHDELLIDTADEDIFEGTANAQIPDGSDNLAWRAALSVRRESGTRVGLAVRLEKRIPVAAGLGGGSADAAATLAAVGRLLGVDAESLAATAPALGSDIPFCLAGGFASVAGAGEIVSPLGPLKGFAMAVVVPPRRAGDPGRFLRVGSPRWSRGSGARRVRRSAGAPRPCSARQRPHSGCHRCCTDHRRLAVGAGGGVGQGCGHLGKRPVSLRLLPRRRRSRCRPRRRTRGRSRHTCRRPCALRVGGRGLAGSTLVEGESGGGCIGTHSPVVSSDRYEGLLDASDRGCAGRFGVRGCRCCSEPSVTGVTDTTAATTDAVPLGGFLFGLDIATGAEQWRVESVWARSLAVNGDVALVRPPGGRLEAYADEGGAGLANRYE